MQAFRSTARVASQFRPTGLPRFYSTQKSYEHLLVSTPKPGVGFSEYHPHLIDFVTEYHTLLKDAHDHCISQSPY